MELEFCKHFKDATSLLLMMDHDSGYVEGAESSTSLSNESDSLKEEVSERPCKESVNFFLSEDALLEKPDITFNLGSNLPYEIDTNDYEESRKLFLSPEVVSGSVPSQNSTITYSGLETDTSSDISTEIKMEPQIVVETNNDIISGNDMSLEQTFVPVIIEPSIDTNCNVMNSQRESHKDPSEEAENSCVTTPHKINDLSISSIPKRETPSKSNQPLTTITNTFDEPLTKHKLTLIFSKAGKENSYSVKRKYPSMTPEKKTPKVVDSNISPDIFDDEIIDNDTSYFKIQMQDNLSISTQMLPEDKYVTRLDQKLLRRVQNSMNGVLPPPSVTVIRMSANDILNKLEQNKSYWFWNNEKPNISLNSNIEIDGFSKSLLLSADVQEAKTSDFSKVYNMRCHGLHFNCGKISEEIVDLCDKYQKRFVGAETQSTCTIFEMQNTISPSKRKLTKPKWGVKSPGRRLSHLARRRITFSSANLQAGSSSIAGSRARQILVDAKKIDLLNRRKSPKKSPWNARRTPKKTPSKSPKLKTRTPSSSAKKKLALRFRKLAGEFENSLPSTSEVFSANRTLFKSPDKGIKSENTKGNSRNTKRALFQSPQHDANSSLFTAKSQDSSTCEERTHLRKALFASPRKSSPKKSKKSPFRQFGFEKKRKRSESDDLPPSKLPRSMSLDVRTSTSNINKSLSRTQSELNISLNKSQSQTELSEQHKKKLLWAVSGALQSQNITNTHPQWKVFASVLARVTRRFFISQMAASTSTGSRLEGGTTERMHRIARYHVISVIKGKSADEIFNDYMKTRVKVHRPQGYIAPEEFNNGRIKAPSGGKENVFQDRVNTIESWEKKKLDQPYKQSTTDIKIERIRKVINFGEDRREFVAGNFRGDRTATALVD